MEHISLRPHVANIQELYGLLGARRVGSLKQVAAYGGLTLASVVVALLNTGTVANVAFCMAAFSGMGWASALMEFRLTEWAMHTLTLHDLVRPRDPMLDWVFESVARTEALVATYLAGQAVSGWIEAGVEQGIPSEEEGLEMASPASTEAVH